MAKKQAHLSDLLKTGKEIRFTGELDDEEVEIVIWLRKPSAAQHEQAVAKARGVQARRRSVYRDKNSDEYLALMDELEQFSEKADLIEQLLRFDESELRTQAYNEVLYDPELAPKNDEGEPYWGEDGQEYLDLLSAMTERMAEIQKFNEDLGDQDADQAISYEDDEELSRLEKQRETFDEQANERFERLAGIKENEYKTKRFADLRQDLFRRLVDLDTSLAWHDQYRKWVLFFTCRMSDNHDQRYFQDIETIEALPPFVYQRLWDEVDSLSQGLDDTKNLLSLQPS